MPEETTPAVEPAPKRKKSRLLIIIVAVVVLVAGAGGYMFMQRGSADAKATAKAKPAPSGPAQYWTLDPALVVNFQDKRAIRFLQVGVSLMSHDPKAIDAAKAAEPRIRNALVLLFSSQDFQTLSTTEGKLKLQKEALHKVREVLKVAYGKPGIEGVYFTSFVMQ